MRYRIYPNKAQEQQPLPHCAHARFVWNLAVDQASNYRVTRRWVPTSNDRFKQLTEARVAFDWLRQGPNVVQQQALCAFDQATCLEDKAKGRVEYVPAAYTSQRCSTCQSIDSESRKSQATFECVFCGFSANADVNVAINIVAGHVVTVQGGSPLG